MGLTLVVYPAGRFDSLRKFPLNGERLTLGAGPGSAVEIDAPNIRPHHAILSCRGGEWFLQGDEECSVGEVPLAEESTRVVRPGDPIRVGDVLMELRPGTADEAGDEGDTEEFLRRPPWPTIRVTEGPSVGHVLGLKEEGKVYLVGRGSGADLKIEDRNVSREHLEVVRKKDGIVVMDRTSTRGSWLGYTRLVPQRRARWDNRRMLKLGVTVLVVDEPAERVAEFSLRPPEAGAVSVGRLSTTSLSYEDEGRDATASGVMLAPTAVPSSPMMLGGARPRAVPPAGPSALRTVLKVLAIVALAGAVAGLIALVALLAR
jgi:pSer/pThr/pTyr-binding forkhead associated (FHA) protein